MAAGQQSEIDAGSLRLMIAAVRTKLGLDDSRLRDRLLDRLVVQIIETEGAGNPDLIDELSRDLWRGAVLSILKTKE